MAGPLLPPAGHIDDDVFLDREHGWLSVFNLDNVGVSVYRTRDGGVHWRGVAVTGHSMAAGSVARIWFSNAQTGWLVNEQPTGPSAGLYVTSDGGAHWRVIADDLAQVAPVAFSSPRVAWQSGGLLSGWLERSRDGGRSWQRVSLPAPAAERFRHSLATVGGALGGVLESGGDSRGRVRLDGAR